MEFFKKAKSVRLKSHHDKYLTADSDEETVVQDRQGSSKSVKWTVEFVEGIENVLRLKSCYGKYLSASDEQYLLGVTGRKVIQTMPRKLDSSIEWEPIRDGMQVKFKSRYGNFLRANGGLPPWRNSITHDIPHRHHGWILWEVDITETRPDSPPKVTRSDTLEGDLSTASFNLISPGFRSYEVCSLFVKLLKSLNELFLNMFRIQYHFLVKLSTGSKSEVLTNMLDLLKPKNIVSSVNTCTVL